MPAHQVRRRFALRCARFAQGSTAVLAVVAVGAVVFAVPGLGAPALAPPPTTAREVDPETSKAAEDQGFPVDHAAIVERFLGMLNAPQEQEEAELATGGSDGDSDAPPSQAPDRDTPRLQIRYVGSMTQSGGKSWAFIVVDGKQRWVRQGDQIGDKTLVGVDPEHIVLEADGEQSKIPLQTKIGRSVTSVTQAGRDQIGSRSVRDRAADQVKGRAVQDAELERRREIQSRGNRRNN